ncbi:MAG: EAL domain-containing protein [Candidatus Marinimicrobia bacterium]|nr:EAL domain-containing protein [Candidatus Neomarinimicrobiota bacterium]
MKKILIIEDEQPIREIISEVLHKRSYDVHLAQDGFEGLKEAERVRPDLIISDIMMPNLDGYDVLRRLRELEETRTTPFIFLTSRDDRNDFRRGMELGADDFISKPFSVSEIINAVEMQIKKQENRVDWLTEEIHRKDLALNQLLRFDGLTGLPNRVSVRDYFETWVSNYPQEKIAVLSLTLDHFRLVHDVYGHEIADKMVREVSRRLKNICTTNELVARLHDSDFVIMIRGFSDKIELTDRSSKFLDLLRTPCDLDGHQVQISGSIGIANYPTHGDRFDQLLKKANMARYNVKSVNTSAYEMYAGEMDHNSNNNFEIESALRQAIHDDALQLYYQPIALVETGKIIGAEALLRFNGYHNGIISPTKFIPIAEMSDLIIEIGDYVMEKASMELANIHANGFPEFRMSINISAGQFRESNLVENILNYISTANLDPKYLTLELTETDLVKDEETSYKALRDLKERGIKIAIDDFGMGYSSFSHLQKFSFDFLKMDQFFVRHLHESDSNKEITRSIIQMAHNLDLRVVAEGVESDEQREFLQDNHCDKCQGFLISEPLPAEKFKAFLDNYKKPAAFISK